MDLKTIFFTCSAILSVGCSEVEVLTGNSYEEHGIYKIFSSKTEFSSRVTSDGAWEKGDAIGLYVFESESGKVTSAGINVKYNAAVEDENAVFSPENTAAVIPDVNSDFVAYYPFSEDVAKIDKEAAVYKIDLSDQTLGFKNHDLIYAKLNSQSVPALSGGGLSMDFSHKLSLVQVNVRGLGTDETVNSITVSGLNTTANFDLVEGVIKNEGNIGNIKLQKLSDNSFVGVMLPTITLAGMKISIETTGARKFQYSPKDENTITEFTAGNKYVYEITASEGSDEETPENVLDGYEQVNVTTGTTDLSALLTDKSGKVALVFESGVSYNISGINIPNAITDLMLYGNNESATLSNTLDELPSISFSAAAISFTDNALSGLSFVGMKLSGDGGDALIASNIFKDGAQVRIKDCKIDNFKNILHIDAEPENSTVSVDIENSIISNSADLIWKYALSSLYIRNSTVYKMNIIARSGRLGVVAIENCTLVDFSATLVEDSGNLIFNNNILSSFATDDGKDNLCYRITAINAFSGNYYESATDDGKYPMIQNHGNDIDTNQFPNAWQSKENIFDGTNANATEGKFYTTISTSGDPRWRQTETTSVK